MHDNEILREVWRAKDTLSKQFGYDVRKMARHYMEQDASEENPRRLHRRIGRKTRKNLVPRGTSKNRRRAVNRSLSPGRMR